MKQAGSLKARGGLGRMLWPQFVLSAILLASSIARAQVGLSPAEMQLFNLVNQERKAAQLPKLKWDYHLAEVARAHATLMAKQAKLSYGFPGEAQLIDRIAASGARFDRAGESVVKGATADEAHHALMSSQALRANLLSKNYNAVGLAAVERDGQLYVAEEFAHVLPPYTEAQFRDAVIAAFNDARRKAHISPIDARPDERLVRMACSRDRDPAKALSELPGATDIVIFSLSEPQKLPTHMQQAAGNQTLHRMNIGVCFPGHGKRGYSLFWVAASFYPAS